MLSLKSWGQALKSKTGRCGDEEIEKKETGTRRRDDTRLRIASTCANLLGQDYEGQEAPAGRECGI